MTTCPQCGTQNLPGMAYCEHCGSPLSTPEETPPVAAAPAAATGATDSGAADAIAQAQAMLDQLNAGDQSGSHPPADQVGAPADAAPAGNAAVDSPAVAVDPTDQQAATASAAPDAQTAPADPGIAPAVQPATAGATAMTITFSDGAQFKVLDDVTNVGRSDVAQNWHPELDVIPYGGGAPDFGVSRHQAVIQRSGGTFTVLDVGSTNGTFVNGKILEYNKPVELHDGDTLAFGAFNSKITIQ